MILSDLMRYHLQDSPGARTSLGGDHWSKQAHCGFLEKPEMPFLKGVQPGWVVMSCWGLLLTFKSLNLLFTAPAATTQQTLLQECSREVGPLSKLPRSPRRLPDISLRPNQDAFCSGLGWQPKSLRAIPFHATSECISCLEVKDRCSPGRYLNKSLEPLASQIQLDQDVRLCSALT